MSKLHHLLGKGFLLQSLVCDVNCIFVTSPHGVLGQVLCLIALLSDLCYFTYFGFPYIVSTDASLYPIFAIW